MLIDEALNKRRGVVHTGYLDGPQLIDGAPVRLPFTVVVGEPGPTVALTAGSHGDEINGVQAVAFAAASLDPQRLRGTVISMPVLNPLAYRSRSRYSFINPTERSNLHDSFPGDSGGDTLSRLCVLFADAILTPSRCDLLIDIHTGAPGNDCATHVFFSGNGSADVVARASAAANVFGGSFIMCAGPDFPAYSAPTMVHSYAHDRGVAAIGCELGSAIPCKADQVAEGVSGVRNVLAHLGMIEAPPPPPPPPTFRNLCDIRAGRGGLCVRRVEPGEDVRAGQTLAVIHDLAGRVVEEASSPVHGRILSVNCFGALNEGERLARVAVR